MARCDPNGKEQGQRCQRLTESLLEFVKRNHPSISEDRIPIIETEQGFKVHPTWSNPKNINWKEAATRQAKILKQIKVKTVLLSQSCNYPNLSKLGHFGIRPVVVDAPVADMLSSRILGVKPIIKYAAQPPSVNVIPSSVAPDAPLSPPSPHPPLSPPAPHPPASSCRPPGLHCLSPDGAEDFESYLRAVDGALLTSDLEAEEIFSIDIYSTIGADTELKDVIDEVLNEVESEEDIDLKFEFAEEILGNCMPASSSLDSGILTDESRPDEYIKRKAQRKYHKKARRRRRKVDSGHTIPVEMSRESEISDLRVVDLRAELDKRGLTKCGPKSALIQRLRTALKESGDQTGSLAISNTNMVKEEGLLETPDVKRTDTPQDSRLAELAGITVTDHPSVDNFHDSAVIKQEQDFSEIESEPGDSLDDVSGYDTGDTVPLFIPDRAEEFEPMVDGVRDADNTEITRMSGNLEESYKPFIEDHLQDTEILKRELTENDPNSTTPPPIGSLPSSNEYNGVEDVSDVPDEFELSAPDMSFGIREHSRSRERTTSSERRLNLDLLPRTNSVKLTAISGSRYDQRKVNVQQRKKSGKEAKKLKTDAQIQIEIHVENSKSRSTNEVRTVRTVRDLPLRKNGGTLQRRNSISPQRQFISASFDKRKSEQYRTDERGRSPTLRRRIHPPILSPRPNDTRNPIKPRRNESPRPIPRIRNVPSSGHREGGRPLFQHRQDVRNFPIKPRSNDSLQLVPRIRASPSSPRGGEGRFPLESRRHVSDNGRRHNNSSIQAVSRVRESPSTYRRLHEAGESRRRNASGHERAYVHAKRLTPQRKVPPPLRHGDNHSPVEHRRGMLASEKGIRDSWARAPIRIEKSPSPRRPSHFGCRSESRRKDTPTRQEEAIHSLRQILKSKKLPPLPHGERYFSTGLGSGKQTENSSVQPVSRRRESFPSRRHDDDDISFPTRDRKRDVPEQRSNAPSKKLMPQRSHGEKPFPVDRRILGSGKHAENSSTQTTSRSGMDYYYSSRGNEAHFPVQDRRDIPEQGSQNNYQRQVQPSPRPNPRTGVSPGSILRREDPLPPERSGVRQYNENQQFSRSSSSFLQPTRESPIFLRREELRSTMEGRRDMADNQIQVVCHPIPRLGESSSSYPRYSADKRQEEMPFNQKNAESNVYFRQTSLDYISQPADYRSVGRAGQVGEHQTLGKRKRSPSPPGARSLGLGLSPQTRQARSSPRKLGPLTGDGHGYVDVSKAGPSIKKQPGTPPPPPPRTGSMDKGERAELNKIIKFWAEPNYCDTWGKGLDTPPSQPPPRRQPMHHSRVVPGPFENLQQHGWDSRVHYPYQPMNLPILDPAASMYLQRATNFMDQPSYGYPPEGFTFPPSSVFQSRRY